MTSIQRALADSAGGSSVQARELAQLTKVPPGYLYKILTTLRRAGVLAGSRGSRGGYQLARAASEIHLIEVVAMFEVVRPNDACLLGEFHRCDDDRGPFDQELARPGIGEGILAPKFNARFNDITWYRQNVPCMQACPVHTESGRYVQLIAEGEFEEAFLIARSSNPLASVCGRVCAAPCEDACRRGWIDDAVTIRPLKRFVTENWGAESARPESYRKLMKPEGVKLHSAWGPRAIVGDARVEGVEFVRCTRVFDDSGRFNPEFDESKTMTLETDSVVLAIGQQPDFSFFSDDDGVELRPGGTIKIDPDTLATTAPAVFAGGDAAFGPRIAIEAIGRTPRRLT